jgi:hypothetical protein
MGRFSDTGTYTVTAWHRGWLGWSKVARQVTSRSAAKQLARKWARRGYRDVRILGGGWFS